MAAHTARRVDDVGAEGGLEPRREIPAARAVVVAQDVGLLAPSGPEGDDLQTASKGRLFLDATRIATRADKNSEYHDDAAGAHCSTERTACVDWD